MECIVFVSVLDTFPPLKLHPFGVECFRNEVWMNRETHRLVRYCILEIRVVVLPMEALHAVSFCS